METLLKNDFTAHYSLPVSVVTGISANTTAKYFELNDDAGLVHTMAGGRIARYRNQAAIDINVINFESFINSLPIAFVSGKEKCDLIVHDTNGSYLLFNELTDTHPQYIGPFVNTRGPQPGKRQKAISQLLSSVTLTMAVPSIATFAAKHTTRHCCFFSKQPTAPARITATTAFNRFNTISSGGLRMPHSAIEGLGFELWEYAGNHIYNL